MAYRDAVSYVNGLSGVAIPLGVLKSWTNFESDTITMALESHDRRRIISAIELFRHAIEDAPNPREFVQLAVVRWIGDVKKFGPTWFSAYQKALAEAKSCRA